MDKDIHSLKEILVDAARYRWIRANILSFGEDVLYVDDEKLHGCARYITAEECDRAIDEQLKAENE